ncbi:MAG: flagellar biosynthesis protein FlhA, partial [Alphaproteobacteria bacterium]|nr:flagellar biosynthesis protein FlhA [Alphaproteobacteria bacterium]
GGVIQGFAEFVMNGNVFLGVVVFCVLLIVNFMVITKGATRMAEVGARFALDGMPGKQLAIDSDVSSGAIDHAEAKARREREQRETTFFGSLDGASKFVKGDAVAGLLITLLNIVVGTAVGLLVHGLPIGQAFETYAILTVGDGLVSQIPAVIISIAAALLLARGGAIGATDSEVLGQLGKHPAALGTVAVLMALFALVPGLPFVPFFLGGLVLGFTSWRMAQPAAEIVEDADSDLPQEPARKALGDVLDLDDIHVEFAPDLVNMVLDPGTGLDVRINNMRSHIAGHFGVILPEIRLTDDAGLPTGTYVIRIQGVETAKGVLNPDCVLALVPQDPMALPSGDDVEEPVYGAPARWIRPENQEAASLSGVTIVSPAEVLATHLLEVVKRNFPRLLSLKSLRRLMDEMTSVSDPARAEANRRLLEEMIPDRVPMDILHSVLRLLLEEQVSVRNLSLILEAIAEARMINAAPDAIAENVRQRLGFQLVAGLRREDGTIPLIQLDQAWEDIFATYQIEGDRGGITVALPSETFEKLTRSVGDEVEKAGAKGIQAAIVTSARRRRFLRTVLHAKGVQNPVLSFEEIGYDAQPALVGIAAA